MLPRTPALPDQPYVEIEKPWSMGEGSHGMALHRDAMLVDLVVEGFAQGDGVAAAIFDRRNLGIVRGKPQVEMIKKVKTRRIN